MIYPNLESPAGKAIWNVLNKRMNRGASEDSIINWLEGLKITWKDNKGMLSVLNGYIEGFNQ